MLPLFILYLVVLGMAAGWVAKFIVAPRQQVSWTSLFIAGLVGSFVGGVIGSLIFEGELAFKPSGLIGSILGAVVVLALFQLITGRSPK